MPTHDRCSHGKLWSEDCPHCEEVWLTHILRLRESRLAETRLRLEEVKRRLAETQERSI